MRAPHVLAWAFAVLVLVAAFADAYVAALARDNLTNEGFNRGHERTPADLGLAFQDVAIDSGGLRLSGWWIPGPASAQNASTTVILVHGLGSTMGKVVRMWAPNLHDAGYSLLAFDLRNHGASPDTPSGFVTYGATEADDVAAAVAYVQANAADLRVDADRIVLYGGSMGGATVLNAGARQVTGVIGVLADSSYASFTFQAHIDGEKKGYPRPLVDLVLDRMDALAPKPPSSSRPDLAVQRIDVPLLLAHCSDDARILLPNFWRLVDLAPPGTTTWTADCPVGLSKDHHLDGWMDPAYNATVRAFLGRL
ncbi:MAG TPA: alpha/beta fold hydrolase [Candidatus Thermoplasmatota archaeon]|nr:alpha/beta fold hydrolase [Candidatus Thermoplasmatota archaeon]